MADVTDRDSPGEVSRTQPSGERTRRATAAEAATVFERRGDVAWLTFNRPRKLNALDRDALDRCLSHLDEVREDPAIRALLITGAGRGFCAGADRTVVFDSPLSDAARGRRSTHEAIQQFTSRIYYLDKPVIAAVNGPAVGGGFELSLACDVRIAAQSAYFMEAAMQHGLIPGDGAVLLLPQIIGRGRAFEALMTGERISAERAAEIGLVNRVVPDQDMGQAAQECATELAKLAPDAIAMLKQALRFSAGGPELGSVFAFLRVGVAYGKTLRRSDGSWEAVPEAP
jgi:enoyl-CoA hydratase/carnithine racemase